MKFHLQTQLQLLLLTFKLKSMETNPVISIRNLQKNFLNGKEVNHVLKGINLDIAPGQIIGYIGPNGAGKSTTVKILCGLIEDFEGDITVLGHDLRTESLAIKRRIGYIPENAAMYDMLTPMEYMSFAGALYGLPEERVMEKAGKLLELFEMKKHADQRMDTFSKGMKQKILLISGLIHNPDIIFLDEPLSGLDANSVMVVKEVLSQLAKDGKTIFFCSHIMDVVERISHRIVLINHGHVVADGTIEELRSGSSETLEKLFADLTGQGGQTVTAEAIVQAFGN